MSRRHPTLFVSKPVVDRLSAHWSVQLSKGVVRSDGRFLGAIVVSMEPQYLTDVYKGVYVGNQGVIALVGTDDFVLRARWSVSNVSPGEAVPDASRLQPPACLRNFSRTSASG